MLVISDYVQHDLEANYFKILLQTSYLSWNNYIGAL